MAVHYPIGFPTAADVAGGADMTLLATYDFEGSPDDSLIADGSMDVLINDIITSVDFDERSGAATIAVGPSTNGLDLTSGGIWWMSLAALGDTSAYTEIWAIIEYNSWGTGNNHNFGLLDSTIGTGAFASSFIKTTGWVAATQNGVPGYSESAGPNTLVPAAYATMLRASLRFGRGFGYPSRDSILVVLKTRRHLPMCALQPDLVMLMPMKIPGPPTSST